ncbi:MAG: nucleotide sugar dehydrogenase [Actinomycetota bacterium]
MNVSIFGLGYVGVVSAAALAEAGHTVVGVDTNLTKVEMINAGRSPIIEPGVEDLMARGVGAGRIRATTDAEDAILATDVSVICVGTPSASNGSLDLTQVQKVCQEIGLAVASKSTRHTIVVRSTMLPGSTDDVVIPALEHASGMKAGEGFQICYNPEFLREGTSLADFADPPFTLLGAADEAAAEAGRALYASVSAPVIVAPIGVAEMVKYACNAFHATKITFANEIGNIASAMGVDGRQVMHILTQDTKLNISPAYLRPGFAFGGSCLPKDLRALGHQAQRSDVDVPLLSALLRSNAGQVDRALRMIADAGSKRVGVLGFSFKAGTDDLRESPLVELIERLIGKGYAVRVYDRNVSLAHLQGANRAYIEREIPHIASLMAATVDEIIEASDTIVIGNADPSFARVAADTAGRRVIDLVGIKTDGELGPGYQGISW